MMVTLSEQRRSLALETEGVIFTSACVAGMFLPSWEFLLHMGQHYTETHPFPACRLPLSIRWDVFKERTVS